MGKFFNLTKKAVVPGSESLFKQTGGVFVKTIKSKKPKKLKGELGFKAVKTIVLQ